MNKKQICYGGFWAILFILFQEIAYFSPGWIMYEKYTASFWVGYVFITAAFVLQLFIVMIALSEKKLTKLFYNIPLIRISYTGLIVSFLLGGACMLISPLPYWIAALICVIALAAIMLPIIKASAAAEFVGDIDDKIIGQTAFVKSLTAEAEALTARATTPETKALCKKVYEALRYSDPMSSDALTEIEKKMKVQFDVFSTAVASGACADAAAEALLQFIEERSSKCKQYK